MDSDSEVEHDFPPFLRQYKSGRVERYGATGDSVPAGADPAGTGVSSRDAVINAASGLWARLFLPARPREAEQRLPVVVYYHGGAFVRGSTAKRATHLHLTRLAADAGALVVSPEYRLAPEHPLPTAFEDSWEALQWVASPTPGDPWLAEHGDLSRVFLAGASAGATIAHDMAVRVVADMSMSTSITVRGLLLVHPFFAGESRISEAEPADREKAGAFWRFRCPGTPGLDDPLCNPFSEAAAGSAARVAAGRALVCVAGEDALRDRGVWYYEGLRASGYRGEVALHESVGVGHVFHYADPECHQARALHERVLSFLRDDR
ncbi:hypothetical protein U9M48_037568 [Paspalum notatum var. saurae]|uniref:Alpha/beta hydrolase fold-3 domain-containing protein n=1 Tax=Paspalum notatum var. saurae TaxID=547442 RepID=A0AAQ3UHB8_PASNO